MDVARRDLKRQHGLKPIDESVHGADRALIERLRELYTGSNWTSLSEFSEAIGRVRARKLGGPSADGTLADSACRGPDTGTLSYYMRGGPKGRRVTQEFLYEMFEALNEDLAAPGVSEPAQGLGLTEEVRADTLRLYAEAIRPTQPHRAELIELQTEYRALADRYEGCRQLVEQLQNELEHARVERDALDEEVKLLRDKTELDTEQLRRSEAERDALTARIEELKSDLAHAQRERERVQRAYEKLEGATDKALQAAAVERQLLVEQHEEALAQQSEHLRTAQQAAEDAYERQRSAEAQLKKVHETLTAPSPSSVVGEEGTPALPAGPAIGQLQEVLARLTQQEVDEVETIRELDQFVYKFPYMKSTVLAELCTYIQRVRPVASSDRGAGLYALITLAQMLRSTSLFKDSPALDLSGADLSLTSFRECNLRGADLSGCRLNKTDFRGADLRNAVLADAELLDADLDRARLNGTDLSGAKHLTAASMASAKLDKDTVLPDNLSANRKMGWRGWSVIETGPSALPKPQNSTGMPTVPEPREGVGQLLKEARTHRGLSLAQVSQRTGIGEGLLEKIERDDPRGLRFHEAVTRFAQDVDADPLQVRRLLANQAARPIERGDIDEPKPWL